MTNATYTDILRNYFIDETGYEETKHALIDIGECDNEADADVLLNDIKSAKEKFQTAYSNNDSSKALDAFYDVNLIECDDEGYELLNDIGFNAVDEDIEDYGQNADDIEC